MRLRVSADDCTGDDALHQVACCSLERGGRREDVYPRIRMLLKEVAPAVPPLLRERARIRHFDGFVTTTIDPLLAQAPGAARVSGPPGAPRTVAPASSPNRPAGLAPEARSSETPTVLPLLGRLSGSPDPVTRAEDRVEFFTAMPSESQRPNVLLDGRKGSGGLLMGSTFPDWLARFLLRIAKAGACRASGRGSKSSPTGACGTNRRSCFSRGRFPAARRPASSGRPASSCAS